MPKPYTFPTLLNEVNTITIKNLKNWDYLPNSGKKEGVVIWSLNGEETSSIRLLVDIDKDEGRIFLSYTFRGEDISYKVPLESRISNLGKGRIWFFICPFTGKRCRKLYLLGKYFCHRECDPSALYESQIYSKKSRALIGAIKAYLDHEKLKEDGQQIRVFYNGKVTKKYERLTKLMRKISGFNSEIN